MIGVLQRGVKKEARAIEELLRSTDLFEKDAVQRDVSGFVGSDYKGDFQRISCQALALVPSTKPISQLRFESLA